MKHLPAFFLALLFLAFLMLGPAASATHWSSDDHALNYRSPLPNFADSLVHYPNTKFTVHRWLCYPVIGYGGAMMGPHLAHWLMAVLHAGVAFVLFAFGRQLGIAAVAAMLGSLTFLVSPWSIQPAIWWSAVNTMTSSLMFLGASMLFLSWLRQKQWAKVVSANLLMFLSLSLYDLWLPSGLFFFALAWFEGRHAGWRAILARTLGMMPAFLVWLGLLLMFGGPAHAAETTGHSWERLPIVFLSLHARIVQWFVGPDWMTLWRQGAEALRQSPGLTLLFLGAFMASIAACMRPFKKVPNDFSSAGPKNDLVSGAGFWRAILLCYALFLSGRLIMLIVGGTNLHGRHAYGASLAFALALAFGCDYGWQRWFRHREKTGAVAPLLAGALLLSLLALASAGKAWHLAQVSRREMETVSQVLQEIGRNPRIEEVVVLGSPLPSHGEIDYFNENEGAWLQFHLNVAGWQGKASVNPGQGFAARPGTRVFEWQHGRLNLKL